MRKENNNIKPFFSVIILAYQVELYLEECLDSVLEQSFQDFEVLIVVPMCTDRTEEIAKQYAKSDVRIRLLKIENQGQLFNRIEGFSRARGQYLLCMDGDDRWEPILLETVYLGVKKNSCDMVIFGHKRFQGDKIVQEICGIFSDETVFQGEGKKSVYEKLLCGGPINEIWAKVMSKKLFLNIKQDFTEYMEIRSGEDWLYSCYAVLAAERILYLDKMLYQYRLREDSISHSFRKGELQDILLCKKLALQLIPIFDMDKPASYEMVYKNVVSSFNFWIYRCAASELPFGEKKELFQVLRNDPLYRVSRSYSKKVPIMLKHRPFYILFEFSDILLEIYTRLYFRVKRLKKNGR